jgi:hypothetical protein
MPDNTVMMEGVQIVFRNFAGKEGPYNKEGDRNFGVLLDDTVATAMAEDGWNIKWLKPREDAEEEETEQAWLPVALKYQGRNGPVRPPTVALLNSQNKRRNLGEEEVEILDWAEITNVDLIVRPYTWEVQGKSGVKAYLKSMFVTIEEDELERKYAEMDAQ